MQYASRIHSHWEAKKSKFMKFYLMKNGQNQKSSSWLYWNLKCHIKIWKKALINFVLNGILFYEVKNMVVKRLRSITVEHQGLDYCPQYQIYVFFANILRYLMIKGSHRQNVASRWNKRPIVDGFLTSLIFLTSPKCQQKYD